MRTSITVKIIICIGSFLQPFGALGDNLRVLKSLPDDTKAPKAPKPPGGGGSPADPQKANKPAKSSKNSKSSPTTNSSVFFEYELGSADLCGNDPNNPGNLTFETQTEIESTFLDLVKNETVSRGIQVDWERATIFSFTQAGICGDGSRRTLGVASTNAATKLSTRGKCAGSCPNELSPPSKNSKGRMLEVDYFDVTGQAFTVNGSELRVETQDLVDCTLDSNCKDTVEGKCCGARDCDCPIVSYSECNSAQCDVYGARCCDPKFDSLCGDDLACECFDNQCGSAECCGADLDVCKDETTKENVFSCQCYSNDCQEEGCCEGPAAGVCGAGPQCS